MKKLFLLSIILFIINACSQTQETSVIKKLNEVRKNQNTSIAVFKQIIDLKNTKITQIAKQQPEKYMNIANYSKQVYNAGNDIYSDLDKLKSKIINNNFIDDLYIELTDTDIKVNTELFKIILNDFPSIEKKINYFYLQNKEITKTYNLSRYNSNFDTKRNYKNLNGLDINYLDFKFEYKTKACILVSIENLQFEIRHFQYLFINSIVN